MVRESPQVPADRTKGAALAPAAVVKRPRLQLGVFRRGSAPLSLHRSQRVIATREMSVKIRSQLFTAGVLIALAVPAVSNAARASVIVPRGHHATSASHAHTSAIATTSAKAKPTTPVEPTYIYVPVSTPAPIAESQLEQCQTQGIGCTDQQFCSFWQINCASVASSDTSGVSSDDASASSDSGTYVDSYDQLLALENEDCCDPSSCMSMVS
jgi:hypothetical protein